MAIFPIILLSLVPVLPVRSIPEVPATYRATGLHPEAAFGAETSVQRATRAKPTTVGLQVPRLPRAFTTAGAKAVLHLPVGAAAPPAEKAEAPALRPADPAAEEGVDFSY